MPTTENFELTNMSRYKNNVDIKFESTNMSRYKNNVDIKF
jgi:hypothetical protein